MADNNKLELVVEVDVNKANASIKSINTGLSSMEQAAGKAASGATAGIDGMTASMVKGATAGNLLADSIKKALDWAKDWTIGAAQYAAHTDKMGLSMQALAKAHGVSTDAANRAVESVKKIGFGTQDAVHAVDRLMIADMSLAKAEGLAKVAKDAAAIENIAPGEALEKLMLAIESGASRGLRTMGIFIDLNKEVDRQQKLTGKSLSENEVLELRYNAVMREATKIQGAHAAATGSAEAQSAALSREVQELKKQVGEQFQGYLRAIVGHLRDLVGFLKDNSDWLVKFGQAAIFVAGAIVTYGIITKISGIASAVEGLGAALAANPWSLLLTGIVAGGAVIYKSYNDMMDQIHQRGDQMLNDATRQQLATGKLHVADLRKRGMTDDQIHELVIGKKLAPGESDDFGNLGLPKLHIKVSGEHGLSDDEVDRIATERTKRGEAEKSAHELYLRAVEERKSAEHDQARARIEDSMKIIESTHSETQAARESLNVVLLSLEERQAGIAKLQEEEKREIEQRSTYTDEKSGAVRHFKLNQSTLEAIHQATAEKLAAFDLRFGEEESRRLEAMMKASAARTLALLDQLYFEPMKQNLYVWEQKQEWQDKIDDQARSNRVAGVDQHKDLQLTQLDSVDARTLRDKVALENAKTAIEVQAMKDRAKFEMEEIDARTEHQVDEARKQAMAQGIFYEPYLKEIEDKVRGLGQHEKDALQGATANQVDVEQAKGANATRQLVVGEYQRIFNSLKQEAGGVFDALLSKSQSVWSAIGNSLKTALLTAIKDVVTSRIAASLMGMFVPGARTQFPGQSGLGVLGALGIGAAPVFAGGGASGGGAGVPTGGGGGWGMSPVAALGAMGGSGSVSSLGALSSIVGGPGGTSGFADPVGGGTGVGMDGSSLGGGVRNMLRGGWGSLKSLAGFGNLATDSQGTKWANINNHMIPLDSAGNIAMVAATSPAAMAAGGLLATSGLLGSRRGTWGGVAMGTAGGALLGAGIGMQFGGPAGALLGAGIGAAAGFGIGIGEKLAGVETPEAEAKRLVKQLYQVSIDTAMAKQIVDLAKQKYSGHVSLAVRDPDIRKAVELYAAATGQHRPLSATTPHGASLIELGSKLYQAPTYMFGNPNVYQSRLPTIGGPAGQYPGPLSLQVTVSGQGAAQFVAGQVVTPEFVQSQWSNAAASSQGRVQNSAWMQQPGLVVG